MDGDLKSHLESVGVEDEQAPTGIRIINGFGVKWYGSFMADTKVKDFAVDQARKNNRKFIVAQESLYVKNGEKKRTFIFGSFKSHEEWIERVVESKQETLCFYELIPEGTEVNLYCDIEWKPKSLFTESSVKDKLASLLQARGVPPGSILFAQTDSATKGSFHAHSNAVKFKTNADQKRFWQDVMDELGCEENEKWWFTESTERSVMEKTFIDMSVYKKDALLRTVLSKKFDPDSGEFVRRLVPDDVKRPVTDYLVTKVLPDSKQLEISALGGRVARKKFVISRKSLEEIIKGYPNFLGGCSIGEVTSNIISLLHCDGKPCMLTGIVGEYHKPYLTVAKGMIRYHCHAVDCRNRWLELKRVSRSGDVDENEIEDRLPVIKYTQWSSDFMTRAQTLLSESSPENRQAISKSLQEENDELLLKILHDMSNYIVLIGAPPKWYCLYRCGMLAHYLNPPIPYVLWKNMLITELHAGHTHAKFQKLIKVNKHGVPTFKACSLTHEWIDWPQRRECHDAVYRNPTENCSPREFNTFGGWLITRELARQFGSGKPDGERVRQFIKDHWCRGDQEVFEFVEKWLAHLVQRPLIKTRSDLRLNGPPGCGKSVLVAEVIADGIGQHNFYQPSSPDEIVGQFNGNCERKGLIFIDEMVAEKKESQAKIKRFATEKRVSFNQKFEPVHVGENTWLTIFSSNDVHHSFADPGERRQQILMCTDGMSKWELEEKNQIIKACRFSVFNWLYNVDITGFDPSLVVRTRGLTEQQILSMSKVHSWWHSVIRSKDWLMQNVDTTEKDLYTKFVTDVKDLDRARIPTAAAFHIEMKRVWPTGEYKFQRTTEGKLHVWKIILPSHSQLVQAFRDYYRSDNILETDEERLAKLNQEKKQQTAQIFTLGRGQKRSHDGVSVQINAANGSVVSVPISTASVPNVPERA